MYFFTFQELLSSGHTTFMCQSCLENLDIVFQFKLMCIKTHNNLNAYAHALNTNNEDKLGHLQINVDLEMKPEPIFHRNDSQKLLAVYRVEIFNKDEKLEGLVPHTISCLRKDLNSVILSVTSMDIKEENPETINDKCEKESVSDYEEEFVSDYEEDFDSDYEEGKKRRKKKLTNAFKNEKEPTEFIKKKRKYTRTEKKDDGWYIRGFYTEDIHKSIIVLRKTVEVVNNLEKNIKETKFAFNDLSCVPMNCYTGRNFVCTICGNQFPHMESFERHSERSHDFKKSVICFICMKIVNGNILKRHIHSHFKIIKNLNCKCCRKKFSTRDNLNFHYSKYHNGMRHYCTFCNEFFKKKKELLQHQEDEHDIAQKVFTCKICRRTFNVSGHLKRHNLVHDKSVRPFKCTTCPKAFALKDALKKHMFSHTHEKPFSCPLCDRRYTRKLNLRDHIESYHNTQKCEKRYSCPSCDKKFILFKEFKVHRRIHRYETPFGCIVCGKNFRVEAQLNDHITRH